MKELSIINQLDIRALSNYPLEDLLKYESLSRIIGQFNYDVRRIFSVDESYNEMLIAFFASNKPDRDKANKDINRLVMNYLLSFRVFLDHWETYIKRDWKGDKEYFKAFKEATAIEYDNNLGYRITYRLRNYVQHCNMPISRIEHTIVQNQPRVIVLVEREKLINEFDEWKVEELDFLKNQPEEFEILPILESGKDSLNMIHDKLLTYRLTHNFVLNAVEALELKKRYISNEGELAIVDFLDKYGNDFKKGEKPDTTNIKLNFDFIPWPTCIYILKSFLFEQRYLKVLFKDGKMQFHNSEGLPNITLDDNQIFHVYTGGDIVEVDYRQWKKLFERIEDNKYLSAYIDLSYKPEKFNDNYDKFSRICNALFF